MFKFDDDKKQVNHDYENSCPRLLLYIFYAYYNFRKIPTLFHSSHLLLFLICIFINFKSTSTDLVFSFFIYLIHRQLGIIQNRKYPLFLYLQESHFVLATLLKYIKNFKIVQIYYMIRTSLVTTSTILVALVSIFSML